MAGFAGHTGRRRVGAAAAGYARLYRRRGAAFPLFVALAFALLAEAMVVTITLARSWKLSWWEWHLLMGIAFATIAVAARREYTPERFSSLYLDDTVGRCRDISVLFGDLEGFTSYSERHDPTEVALMLNTYFCRLIPLIRDSGGEVDKLIGDSIMAVYNLHGNQPDHPARACRAGLRLQSAVAELLAEHPAWPAVLTVGVNAAGTRRAARRRGSRPSHARCHRRRGQPCGAAGDGRTAWSGGDRRRNGAPAPGWHARVVDRLADQELKGKADPIEAHLLAELPPSPG